MKFYVILWPRKRHMIYIRNWYLLPRKIHLLPSHRFITKPIVHTLDGIYMLSVSLWLFMNVTRSITSSPSSRCGLTSKPWLGGELPMVFVCIFANCLDSSLWWSIPETGALVVFLLSCWRLLHGRTSLLNFVLLYWGKDFYLYWNLWKFN